MVQALRTLPQIHHYRQFKIEKPMPVLRLVHTQDQYCIEVIVEENSRPRSKAITKNFRFALDPKEREDLCWYLEDFLQYDLKLEASRGKRIEQQIKDIGTRLFKAVFLSDTDTTDLWAKLRERIKDTRVEIEVEPSEAAKIPWELIRDSITDRPLALGARDFVRIHPRAARRPEFFDHPDCLRILLVICRTSGRKDEPFRSVASPLVRKLYENPNNTFQLDVLRPPQRQQLSKELRKAKDKGTPYHIVHFDGHGIYDDTIPQGYLLFENSEGREDKVNGSELGELLFQTDVPVLLLNACRSASAQPPKDREIAVSDPHDRVRAFGSLAEQVMEAGLAGVVAMGYNVYVDTAAQFVADLYELLIQGSSLGKAATQARKQLEERSKGVMPMPRISSDTYLLQDWSVPVIYEAAPMTLFKPSDSPILLLTNNLTSARENFDAKLPRPYTGFFGRDETLLAIERAFYHDNVVLLQGETGIGKTTTATEFGRWYALTGGVDRPVLFTKGQELTESNLWKQIGESFAEELKASNLEWWELNDNQKRNIARQLFQQVRILWIWDGVETENPELVNFIRAVKETKAKFLLTAEGKRPEWLENLTIPISMPPMPMLEQVPLARKVAKNQGKKLDEIENWQSLLESTGGKPATIIKMVTQAVKGQTTRELSKVSATQQQGENMPTNASESSDWYVERFPIESICYQTIAAPGSLLRIKAPKQMGKTVLITRIIKQVEQQEQGYRKAYLSLNSLWGTFTNLDLLLQDFCAEVSNELELQSQVGELWDEKDGSKRNCQVYFENYLLPNVDRALVLCLDNVELLFQDEGIAKNFLRLLRAWHERANISPLWKKLRLVVVHSTEVYIQLDLHESPFNVGTQIELPEFTSEQMLEFARKYGLDLTEPQIEQLQQMVGGHPYLVQQAIVRLRSDGNETLDKLLKNAPTVGGIYRKHLLELWQNIQSDPKLIAALKKVVAFPKGTRLEPTLTYKLQLLGLINVKGKYSSPRCELYRRYFSDNWRIADESDTQQI